MAAAFTEATPAPLRSAYCTQIASLLVKLGVSDIYLEHLVALHVGSRVDEATNAVFLAMKSPLMDKQGFDLAMRVLQPVHGGR